jgi:phosphoribosylformylglycinamidine synthase subunit PurQ / glutaminase
MTKIAVILFPGTNCENETVRICRDVGMTADIVRWNAKLNEYDGYILPGGWSYEDRVRAGAIAAKDKVIDKIKEEADKGKVVLGLCNGAQVLIEAG